MAVSYVAIHVLHFWRRFDRVQLGRHHALYEGKEPLGKNCISSPGKINADGGHNSLFDGFAPSRRVDELLRCRHGRDRRSGRSMVQSGA